MVQEPLGHKEKNIARESAVTGWTERKTVDEAKMYAIQLNERWLGQKFLTAAHALSGELIDHWDKRGIIEPPAVFAVGEPGSDAWDEW